MSYLAYYSHFYYCGNGIETYSQGQRKVGCTRRIEVSLCALQTQYLSLHSYHLKLIGYWRLKQKITNFKQKIKRERKSMALQKQNETSQLQQARLQDLSTRNAVHLQEETPEKRQERLQNMSACLLRGGNTGEEAGEADPKIAGQIMHTSTKVCMFTILDSLFIFMLSLPYFSNIR